MTVASIDIGTNTILLLIADADIRSGKIKVVEDHHNVPRIGRGLKKDKPFPPENIERLYNVLIEYFKIILNHKCEKVLLSGTNAFRIASDSNHIIKSIKDKFGYEIKIISGEEEAEYSYLGAVSSFNDNRNFLVIDIGGGSTEIISGNGTNILFSKSFSAGVVSGTENFLTSDPPSLKQIEEFRNNIQNVFSGLSANIKQIDTAVAIAGTPTTLAAIKHNLEFYNEEQIEGTKLTLDEMNTFTAELSELSSSEILNKYTQIVTGREDILLAGTILLKEISEMLHIKEVVVSSKGIRYGAIIKWLNSLQGS